MAHRIGGTIAPTDGGQYSSDSAVVLPELAFAPYIGTPWLQPLWPRTLACDLATTPTVIATPTSAESVGGVLTLAATQVSDMGTLNIPETVSASTVPSWIATLSDPVLRGDMTAIAAGGTITAAEMANVLTGLATELSSQDATLSSAQFNDLKTIAADLNVGESASAYVMYVTNALVNGNAANASWTGGAATSSSLGNLAVGSSAAALSELTGIWLLGTDLPSSTVMMAGYSTFSISYSGVSEPLYGASGPAMSDINQGFLGDCYLESVLAEVANQNPLAIESMITNNGNNTYGIRFFIGGQPVYVTVNDELPDDGTIFNHGSVIWASLVEKAYAQLQAGGEVTGNTLYNDGDSFSSIGNGGVPLFTLEEVTGASLLTNFTGSGTSWFEANYNNGLYYIGGSFGISTASVLSTLVNDLSEGDDLILSSNTNATDSSGRTTLVADHALSVFGYDSATGELEIRNPWGTASGQYWDTTFEVSLNTLLSDGDAISVADAPSHGVVTISGAVAGQRVTDAMTATPFTNVTIADSDTGQTETLTVTLSAAANGTLSNLGGGSYDAATGVYTDTGSVTAVTVALDGLVFIPTVHQVAPGQTVVTTFTIADIDTASASATNSTTTVTTTAVAAVPTIGGTVADQQITDAATVKAFSGVTITDPNAGQTETLTVTLSAAVNGTLSNLDGGSYDALTGVYTDTGSAAAVTSALDGLIFIPTAHQVAPGQVVTTTFTVADTDSAGETVTNSATSVNVKALPQALMIGGTVAGQRTTDMTSVAPFSNVTISDPNPSQAETLTVTLSAIANGTLSNLGGGSFNAATGIYTDTGSATAVTTALDGLVFIPTAHQVAPGQTVTTTFTIQDVDTLGETLTDSTTSVIATAANVTPPVVTAGGSASYMAGAAAIKLDAALSVSDAGTDTLTGATVSITAGLLAGDILNLGTTEPGITSSYDAATGVLTLSGTASVATYQAALESVTYASSADPTGSGADPSRTITWSANDGTTISNAATSTLSTSFLSNPSTDILFQNTDGQIGLWQINGTTRVAYGAIGTDPGSSWYAVATGAFFPGDSSDIVWQDASGQVGLWQVQGTTMESATAVGSNPGTTWHVKGTGVFFSDGNTDILWQNDNGQVGLWDMSGTTIVQAVAVGSSPGSTWQIVGTGDFYGDGNTDILFQNTNGQVGIWDIQNGTTIVHMATIGSNPDPSWHVVGTGDFYGDGNTDILFQNSDGAVRIWDIANGTTIVQSGTIANNPGPTWHVVGTGNFGGGGNADIVWQSDTGAIGAWSMDGTSIVSIASISNPGTTWSVTGDDSMRFIYSTAANETLAATPALPDEFVFTDAAAGAHTITGFNTALDTIELNAAQFPTYTAVEAATSAIAGGAMLNLGNGSSLQLPGVDPSALQVSNFVLA